MKVLKKITLIYSFSIKNIILNKVINNLKFVFRLSATKSILPRGIKLANYFETNDSHGRENENSPTHSNEDSPSNPSQEIDNRLKSLHIQPRT